jgi:hypothetical protein
MSYFFLINERIEYQSPCQVSSGPFQSVSVVIGLQRCGASPCSPGNGDLGEILFAGDYVPTRHENTKPPYQNFTFSIGDTASGPAQLNVVRLALTGVCTTATSVTISLDANF